MSEVVEPVGHSTEDIVELDLGSTDVESGDVTAKTEGPADTPPSDPDNEIHGVVEDHKGDTTENKTNGSIADGTKPAGSSHASGMLQGTKTSMENGAAKAHASGPITSPKKSAATDKAPAGKAVKSATPSASSVKKVISSGTFGAGSVKPTPPVISKASSTYSAPTKPTTASVLRKSTSASEAAKPATTSTRASATKTITATSRPNMSSAKPTTTSSALSSSTSSATRRPSVAPKPPLSSSTTTRHQPSPDTTKAASRSVASPTGSTGTARSSTTVPRPRASISDGMPARRASMGPKPSPPTTTKPSLAARRTPGAGSISSLREIKEDGPSTEDLQKKLSEAELVLKAQTEQIASLQEQLKGSQGDLETALADVKSSQSTVDNLQAIKDELEDQLKEQDKVTGGLQAEVEKVSTALEDANAKLSIAQSELASSAGQLQSLEDQIKNLSAVNSTLKQEYEGFKESARASASDANAASAAEHEALLRAQADFNTIKTEIAALTAAHTSALQEASSKIQELELLAAQSNELSAQIVALKDEKEETANRVSELEIEILELKEAAETAADKETQAVARTRELEGNISTAVAANEQALIEGKKREEDHEFALNEIRRQHEEALKAVAEEKGALSVKLDELSGELAGAVARYDQALVDAKSAEDAHVAKLEEAEKIYTDKASSLSAEIDRLAVELAGQETHYASKVEAVKAEHETRLQQEYERAKTEAGDAHAQELQDLRVNASTSLEQLKAAHQTEIDGMKTEHASELDSRTKSLEKTNNNLALELKATQDDLAKAKTALASYTSEVETLKKQLEEVKANAATIAESSASSQIAEIQRLTRDLSASKDDVSTLHEVLEAQKGSMSEMSRNHTVELEEAAKLRAESVTSLRNEHAQEKTALLGEKSALIARVSDLENELAILQAKVDAQSEVPVSSKSSSAASVDISSITKEELQKLHEAHNSKMLDLEAQHERALKELREDLDSSSSRNGDLASEIERKSMEITFMNAEMEEKDDTIIRLKEDIANISEQMEKLKFGNGAA